MKQLKNKIKIILFDADGVIITGKPFSKYLETRYNIPKIELDTFFFGIFKKCLLGQRDLKEELPPYLRRWRISLSVEEFLYAWFTKENKTDSQLVTYIQKLRRQSIQCHIATNQECYRATFMEKKMKFETFFDSVFASSSLGVIKPDPIFFYKILEKLPFSANEILFWDDSNDHVESAKKLGIHAYRYSNFHRFLITMKKYGLS